MALDVGRWLKYAQAKLDSAVRSGNRELDQLEAEREVELAEKPWLASDGEAPTFDEARARIEWEAEHQRQQAEASAAERPAGEPSTGAPSTDPSPSPGAPTPPAPSTRLPSSGTEAEVAAAKVELEQRDKDAKARLDAIREELDVDPPAPGSP